MADASSHVQVALAQAPTNGPPSLQLDADRATDTNKKTAPVDWSAIPRSLAMRYLDGLPTAANTFSLRLGSDIPTGP